MQDALAVPLLAGLVVVQSWSFWRGSFEQCESSRLLAETVCGGRSHLYCGFLDMPVLAVAACEGSELYADLSKFNVEAKAHRSKSGAFCFYESHEPHDVKLASDPPPPPPQTSL